MNQIRFRFCLSLFGKASTSGQQTLAELVHGPVLLAGSMSPLVHGTTYWCRAYASAQGGTLLHDGAMYILHARAARAGLLLALEIQPFRIPAILLFNFYGLGQSK